MEKIRGPIRSEQATLSWETIGEQTWSPPPRRRFLGRFLGPRTRIRRVRPVDPDYGQVVALRYRGFVETGFVDPGRTGESSMRLARDDDSIILGLFRRDRRRDRLLATMTLNTITPRFPGMAMELDKKVRIDHAHFRDPAVLEITKLVIDRGIRGRRMALGMLYVSSLVARMLGKLHLWQVSREVPSDVSWRVGLGFDYSVGAGFRDPDLNDMPSRVGYLYLPTVMDNPRVPTFIKAIYGDALGAPGQDIPGMTRESRGPGVRPRTPRPHPLVVALVRHVLVPILARRCRLSAAGLSALETVTPPYVVLANHVSFWDPIWVNAFIRHPVQFVASDNLFRTFFLGLAMRLLGAIPKTKLMSDPETVRHILGILAGGGVVGIFPEGSRSNDGRPSPLIAPVARLLRRLSVPVMAARMEGGYLSRPRWARHPRRGTVEITYERIFSGDEITRLTEQEVLQVMGRALAYDDGAWQKARGRRFRSRRPAEYLERLLFLCPHCRAVSRIASLDDRVRCTACEYSVRISGDGVFEPCSGPLYFESPADWNAWQLPAFRRMLAAPGTFGDFLFEEPRARLLTGRRARPLRTIGTGPARLTRGQIQFFGDSGLAAFCLPDVRGVNVQNREKLEFYHDRTLYRLDFADPRASAYKWCAAVEILSACEPEARSLIRVNTY